MKTRSNGKGQVESGKKAVIHDSPATAQFATAFNRSVSIAGRWSRRLPAPWIFSCVLRSAFSFLVSGVTLIRRYLHPYILGYCSFSHSPSRPLSHSYALPPPRRVTVSPCLIGSIPALRCRHALPDLTDERLQLERFFKDAELPHSFKPFPVFVIKKPGDDKYSGLDSQLLQMFHHF